MKQPFGTPMFFALIKFFANLNPRYRTSPLDTLTLTFPLLSLGRERP
jgi:hypothetical protein